GPLPFLSVGPDPACRITTGHGPARSGRSMTPLSVLEPISRETYSPSSRGAGAAARGLGGTFGCAVRENASVSVRSMGRTRWGVSGCFVFTPKALHPEAQGREA